MEIWALLLGEYSQAKFYKLEYVELEMIRRENTFLNRTI